VPVPASRDTPRISIITPCLNRADFVAEAVESVLAQARQDVEHIVVDGGSNDGTLDVLAKYPHLTVVSEPDTGLYDAINKGIRMSTGEVVGLLNSDDVYLPGALQTVAEVFARNPELDVVSGGAEVAKDFATGGRRVVRRLPARRHAPLTYPVVTVGVPIINARFFRRSVFDRVGFFDTDYPVVADREFLLRVVMAGIKGGQVDAVLYRYLEHPGSLTIQARSPLATLLYLEHMRVAERYLLDPAMPAEVRGICRRWHRQESVGGAIEAIRMGRPGELFRFVGRGLRYCPWWPLAFVVTFAWRLVRMRWIKDLRPLVPGLGGGH